MKRLSMIVPDNTIVLENDSRNILVDIGSDYENIHAIQCYTSRKTIIEYNDNTSNKIIYDETIYNDLLSIWEKSKPPEPLEYITYYNLDNFDTITLATTAECPSGYTEEKPFHFHVRDYENEISNKRWEIETGGLSYTPSISGDTYYIHTDRESQSKIIGAYILAKENRFESKIWKTKNKGFIKFTSAQIIEIAELVNYHVQNCYNNEEKILKLIKDASTLDELEKIKANKFNKGWPDTAIK